MRERIVLGTVRERPRRPVVKDDSFDRVVSDPAASLGIRTKAGRRRRSTEQDGVREGGGKEELSSPSLGEAGRIHEENNTISLVGDLRRLDFVHKDICLLARSRVVQQRAFAYDKVRSMPEATARLVDTPLLLSDAAGESTK